MHINALHATGPNGLQRRSLLTVRRLSQAGQVTGVAKSLYHVVGVALKAASKSAKALKSVTVYM